MPSNSITSIVSSMGPAWPHRALIWMSLQYIPAIATGPRVHDMTCDILIDNHVATFAQSDILFNGYIRLIRQNHQPSGKSEDIPGHRALNKQVVVHKLPLWV